LRGFEIGSADAPITIIEYRSLTCSHCADFANDVFPNWMRNIFKLVG
jgi:protein-disulfide isomerase